MNPANHEHQPMAARWFDTNILVTKPFNEGHLDVVRGLQWMQLSG
jgi:hypothetical protein